jgi:hypothetical protein
LKPRKYDDFQPAPAFASVSGRRHILGAAIIELFIEEKGLRKWSFPRHRRPNQLLCRNQLRPPGGLSCHESTYGNRNPKGEVKALRTGEAIRFSTAARKCRDPRLP